MRDGAGHPGWSAADALLLRAADELHDHRMLSDATWQALAYELSDVQRIELCMLVGHYEMLAMTLNTLRVEPDARAIEPRGRLLTGMERLLRRTRRS